MDTEKPDEWSIVAIPALNHAVERYILDGNKNASKIKLYGSLNRILPSKIMLPEPALSTKIVVYGQINY